MTEEERLQAEQEDSLKAAEAVLAHVTMLWDDQVALADSLVEKRKNLATLLAIIVGLGVFRIQVTMRKDEIPIIHDGGLLCFQCCLMLGMSCFLMGGYFLYTQRPNVRRLLFWTWDGCRRGMKFLWKKARELNPEVDVQMDGRAESPWPSGRAVALLLREDEQLEDWFILDSCSVVQIRTERIREAYKSLTTQNRRVAKRLRTATVWIFLGFLLVFVAVGWYTMSIGRTP